jgi:putative sigma-54 modulation protein
MMDIQIESLHFEANNELQSFIIDKVEKLDQVYSRIENCRIILKLDHSDKRKNKIVELIVNIPQLRLFAMEQDESFELAAVQAVDYMKKQLVKHKERLAEHRPAADQVTEEKPDEF